MASINGLSSGSSLNSTSSIRGYGGLASGLDRDSLIEGMTYATRSKIAAQKQKKETISWTQEAMRGITSKVYEFSNKYMSYASSSNLLGSKLFSRSQVTALGTHSNLVSVTGSSVSADTISILGVKSLAQNAQMTTNDTVSDQLLQTGSISNDLSSETWADMISGESLFIKYGTKSYSVTLNLDDEFKFDTTDEDGNPLDGETIKKNAAKAAEGLINRSLKKVSIGDGKTLADVMEASLSDDGIMSFKNNETAGNTLMITGSTGDLLVDLGFLNSSEDILNMPDKGIVIGKESSLMARNTAKVTKELTLAEQLKGKQISFSYNGTIKWITLGDYTTSDTLDTVKDDLQKKLNEAFGKGRITVDFGSGAATASALDSLTFKTSRPNVTGTTDPDPSSVLSITAAERGILGNNSIFGIKDGESNRLNLTTSIEDSGLKVGTRLNGIVTDPEHIDDLSDPSDPNSFKNHLILSNDGVTVDLTKEYGLNWKSSVRDIIEKINGSKELGIKVTYQSNADKFVVQSTEQGASGKIDLDGNLSDVLFGTTEGTAGDYTVQKGKDAEIRVKYAGSGEEMDITRGSNTISIDGLNITVKGIFGYTPKLDADDNPVLDVNGEQVLEYVSGTDPITFDAQVDADNTTKIVKEMVDAYNEALELINKEVNQKPNRDYAPLTDEQRDELSDSQIEKWETEAKKGLLFNDTDVRGLADGLRFVIPASMRSQFEKMGITVSTNYADNGKLVFDETKFKTALQQDPDAVFNAFTSEEVKDSDGKVTQEAGLMTKMKSVMDKYASMTGATKGILVERAGSVYAPTSVLKNSMQKQMDEIDDILTSLGKKLETETDRYIAQFTRLETVISQMNSQSSYLNSMFSA